MFHNKLPIVPPEQWGKDHWGLLAYVEIRGVDHGGILDMRHLRTNVRRAYRLKVEAFGKMAPDLSFPMLPEHGTRLKSGEVLPTHCDCACLIDLEAAGLLQVMDWDTIYMTNRGFAVAAALRKFKAEGGTFNDFTMPGDDHR